MSSVSNVSGSGCPVLPPYPSTQSRMTPDEKYDFSNQLNQMLPPDRLNGMLTVLQNNLLCDSACQREKKIVELRERVYQASNIVKLAPNDLSQAEKNYYEYKGGSGEYLDYLLDKNKKEYEKIAIEMARTELESHKQFLSLIYGFSSQKIHAKEMNKLADILIKDITDLDMELDSMVGITTTSDRKIDYQTRELEWIRKVRYFLYSVYILVFILYILLGNFITDKLYEKKETWGYIILYGLFPIFVPYLSIFSFWLYDKISRLLGQNLPKNVYIKL